MCRRQRRLQCDLQCSQETCLRTDLWYSACYFYLLTKQLCQTILVFIKAIANWSMALMGIIMFEPTRSDHDDDTAGHVSDDSDSEEAAVGENRGYGIIENNIFNKCPRASLRHSSCT